MEEISDCRPKILAFLPPRDALATCRLVCKQFKEIVDGRPFLIEFWRLHTGWEITPLCSLRIGLREFTIACFVREKRAREIHDILTNERRLVAKMHDTEDEQPPEEMLFHLESRVLLETATQTDALGYCLSFAQTYFLENVPLRLWQHPARYWISSQELQGKTALLCHYVAHMLLANPFCRVGVVIHSCFRENTGEPGTMAYNFRRTVEMLYGAKATSENIGDAYLSILMDNMSRLDIADSIQDLERVDTITEGPEHRTMLGWFSVLFVDDHLSKSDTKQMIIEEKSLPSCIVLFTLHADWLHVLAQSCNAAVKDCAGLSCANGRRVSVLSYNMMDVIRWRTGEKKRHRS